MALLSGMGLQKAEIITAPGTIVAQERSSLTLYVTDIATLIFLFITHHILNTFITHDSHVSAADNSESELINTGSVQHHADTVYVLPGMQHNSGMEHFISCVVWYVSALNLVSEFCSQSVCCWCWRLHAAYRETCNYKSINNKETNITSWAAGWGC